ncbi:MAG: hypothetical protein E6J65_22750 [Deltaproteobacteria bacterium]|nr:MAG: hypothetical protein E6J65_22750 [Deltaproteobacteria bacterium]
MILALLLAAAAPIVGVLEFRDKVPPEQRIDVAYLSDQVRAAVKEVLPQSRVITRENMLVLLQASGRNLEECEGECEVDTGRRIGADLVVSGEVLRFGTQYKLNMKLHDTGQGELLSGGVASGATADELDRDLRPAVRRLLAPLLQDRLSDQRQEARETTVQRIRPLPSTAAAVWIVAGYDWTSHTGTLANAPGSAFGWDLGGHLFFRVAGPLYLGALLDYSLSGPNELLAAGGVRLAVENLGISAGGGYANLASGGWGVLGAVDFGLGSGFSLRGQASWRRASTETLPRQEITVASMMGGLSVQF